jgi:predicted kinase
LGKTLVVTVGLPRSGKSTWARVQGFPIVNGDSVRLALHGQRFLEDAEPMVAVLTEIMTKALLACHDTVVVDECNVTAKRRKKWEILAKRAEAALEYQVFTTMPGVCRRRAIDTGQPDLIPVIDRMAAEWDYCSVSWKKEEDTL